MSKAKIKTNFGGEGDEMQLRANSYINTNHLGTRTHIKQSLKLCALSY